MASGGRPSDDGDDEKIFFLANAMNNAMTPNSRYLSQHAYATCFISSERAAKSACVAARLRASLLLAVWNARGVNTRLAPLENGTHSATRQLAVFSPPTLHLAHHFRSIG